MREIMLTFVEDRFDRRKHDGVSGYNGFFYNRVVFIRIFLSDCLGRRPNSVTGIYPNFFRALPPISLTVSET